MDANLRQLLVDLYQRVDDQVGLTGVRCDQSGKCCRFTEYGHTLFISQIEAEYLLSNLKLPNSNISPDTCPFQIQNQCTAREFRPLGCRIYFCDPSYQNQSYAITEFALNELKRLSLEMDLGWEYAPLHHFLKKVETFEILELQEPRTGSTRISLPLSPPS